jgi:hypothetical protein
MYGSCKRYLQVRLSKVKDFLESFIEKHPIQVTFLISSMVGVMLGMFLFAPEFNPEDKKYFVEPTPAPIAPRYEIICIKNIRYILTGQGGITPALTRGGASMPLECKSNEGGGEYE